jgi:hypothetical protein
MSEKPAMVDKRFGPAIKELEFTVPKDYDHDTQPHTYETLALSQEIIYKFDRTGLTYPYLPKATNKLESGRTYRVRIFPILETVTSPDCLTFLKKQGAFLVGGRGLTLLQDNKFDEFPLDKYTVSFDEKDALFNGYVRNRFGLYHILLMLDCNPYGHKRPCYGRFEDELRSDVCLLCFSNS